MLYEKFSFLSENRYFFKKYVIDECLHFKSAISFPFPQQCAGIVLSIRKGETWSVFSSLKLLVLLLFGETARTKEAGTSM